MELQVNDHRKVFAIQQEFSHMFPHLKIEFHSKPSKAGGSHSEKIIHKGSKTLGEARTDHRKGTLSLSSSMTVNELKQNFSDIFGLSVQILKKSGNDWIEAKASNHVTLAEL